jgi:hypothetical protein
MLQHAHELKFQRIIFCGSVVSYRFRVVDYTHRFNAELINEVGTRDIWPVLAETVTTGYGSAGTYGFRRSGVRDRWHNGKTHSAFLTRDFCEKYWVPFLRDGSIIEDDARAEPPPWWLQLVRVFQPRYLVAIGLLCWLAVQFIPPSWWSIHLAMSCPAAFAALSIAAPLPTTIRSASGDVVEPSQGRIMRHHLAARSPRCRSVNLNQAGPSISYRSGCALPCLGSPQLIARLQRRPYAAYRSPTPTILASARRTGRPVQS